jgi:hypothetical protein
VANKLPVLPSERTAAIAQAQKERKDAEKDRIDTLKAVAREVAATPSGMYFLQHLAQICGRNRVKASLRYERGADGSLVLTDVAPNATIYLAARESIWLEIAQLIGKDYAALAEK